MNLHSDGIFQAFSAGSNPASSPHPMTLSILKGQGGNTDTLQSVTYAGFSAFEWFAY